MCVFANNSAVLQKKAEKKVAGIEKLCESEIRYSLTHTENYNIVLIEEK